MNIKYFLLIFIVVFAACNVAEKKQPVSVPISEVTPKVIVDCNYTFDEAVKGSGAPDSILQQLELVQVQYYSFDGQMHEGQVLANKLIANEISAIFDEILINKFPVGKVIPVVRYNWNDNASMNENNSYSFCYRNVNYSKHARGLAIDINPQQNPVRWNKEYRLIRADKPKGAVYDSSKPGTFYPEHPVILQFKKYGFFWGRDFKRNDDDHHFEK